MLYAVFFEDNPVADPGIRPRFMADHLAFLHAHKGNVLAAGPLADEAGIVASGLWLVQAESTEAVERLVHADPFSSTGLRQSHQILEWRRVFADGEKLIRSA